MTSAIVLFLVLLFSALFSTRHSVSADTLTGYGTFTYRYITTQLSWGDANIHCTNAYNGKLAWFASIEENEHVTSMNVAGWIGARTDTGEQFWIDPAGGAFDNWADGEPNDSGGNEKCVEMRHDGQWNDFPCISTKPYVCKYPSTCTGLLWSDPSVCGGHGTCAWHDRCDCDPSYYIDEDDGNCHECEEGHYCLGGMTFHMEYCPPGTWSASGASNVTDCVDFLCPAYYACYDGVQHPCRDAPHFPYDELGGHAECGLCSQGHYSVQWNVGDDFYSCLPCSLGHWCPGNGTMYACEGTGYADVEALEECKQCDAGWFTNNVVCVECAEEFGEFCPNSSVRIVCEPGTYYNEMLTQCLECPEAHICQFGRIQECPAGYYISSPVEDARSTAHCVECPVGWICPGNGTRLQCINQYYNPFLGATECLECGVGYYTGNSSTACHECSQATYCGNGIVQLVCDPGYFLTLHDDPSLRNCSVCPAGFFCVDFQKKECATGYYANRTGSSSCDPCPRGTMQHVSMQASETIDDCIPCPAGYYSEQEGGHTCQPCPVGTWSDAVGASNGSVCIPCGAGTYQPLEAQNAEDACLKCPAGKISVAGASSCDECERGTFASHDGSTECEQCRPGSFASRTGATSCTLCGPGTYNPGWGSESSNDCILCVSGGSSVHGANSSDVCNVCSPGFYSQGPLCLACPPGSYNNDPMGTQCEKCPVGTFLGTEGGIFREQCAPCARGSYASVEGSTQCTLCSRGTIGIALGGNSSSVCQSCPVGHSSREGDFFCVECPPGTFAPIPSSEECLPCPKGSYAANSRSTECLPCAPGSFSEVTGAANCHLCPAGTYNALNGSTSSSACIYCKEGTFSSQIGAPSDSSCNICPKGAFCDLIGMKAAKYCRMGTYSNVEGATSIFTCTACPRGTYGPFEGATSLNDCETCPIGTYNEEGGASSLSLCESCPLGTSSKEPFASSQSVCVPCAPGTYSPFAAARDCLPCGIGRYNPKNGSTTFQDCIQCPVPKITRTVIATSEDACFTCDPGFYFADMVCRPCPVGTYFDPLAEPSNRIPTNVSCIACGAGYYQPFVAQIGSNSCMPCPVATYAPQQRNAKCTPCGKGKYSSKEAAGSESDCISCPPGTWGDLELALTVDDCTLCSPGTYSYVSAADSSATCRLCPPGQLSTASGSANCSVCSGGGTSCSVVGSSFELVSSSSSVLQEQTTVHDPKSFQSTVEHYYDALRYAVPFGLLGIFACIFCCLVAGVSLCLALQVQCLSVCKWLDFIFSTRHTVKVGNANVRRPSVLGALASILFLLLFAAAFTAMVIDFVENNKLVLESFVLENSENVEGAFVFETLVVGEHTHCYGTVQLRGFEVHTSEESCRQVTGEREWMENVRGCLCTYRCSHCRPVGSTHQVLFNISAAHHILSPSVMFRVEVPHYVESQIYYVNGSMGAGKSVFTGNALANTFAFMMNNAKYVSISKIAALYDAVGISEETSTYGYTMQLVAKHPGSVQPQDENFVLQRGMHVMFDIDRATGVVQAMEVPRQSVATFMAQLLTVFSLLLGLMTLGFRCVERVQRVAASWWKWSKSDGRVESSDKNQQDEFAFFSLMPGAWD